jgi:imidazoleglycerol phosphate synthase glutamine amidotransferase subunit HisH
MFKRKETNPDDFWREYEEKTGEKVLARCLGQYLSGWDEFDSKGWNAIWGLVIATTGGFRFHHFPHMGWIEAISRFGSGGEPPKEKTLFLPKERIISVRIVKETKLWKRIFSPSSPKLVISFRTETGGEQTMTLETDYQADDVAQQLGAGETAKPQV